MAAEIESLIRDNLERLPQNHPDRRFLEAQAEVFASFNSKNGRAETAVLPNAEQLVASEKQAWKQFFGKEIDVSTPPQELLTTLARAQEQGITVFEAHFLPQIEFKKNNKYHGWRVKPEDWYWEQIKAGKVAKDAAKLDGVWVLVDGSLKPNYEDGRQLYTNDSLASILGKLRKEGQIQSGDNTPEGSRFRISWDEINQIVNPQLAQLLGVSAEQVRLPKAIEFNIIGNIHHPQWGQTNTWEWFDDKFEADDRLIGGSSVGGGLANVNDIWHGRRDDRIGFRPLVVFSSKS